MYELSKVCPGRKKAGKQENKRTVKQGYWCKDCNRYLERDVFEHEHHLKHIICAALHLFAEGLSLTRLGIFLAAFWVKPADSNDVHADGNGSVVKL